LRRSACYQSGGLDTGVKIRMIGATVGALGAVRNDWLYDTGVYFPRSTCKL